MTLEKKDLRGESIFVHLLSENQSLDKVQTRTKELEACGRHADALKYKRNNI